MAASIALTKPTTAPAAAPIKAPWGPKAAPIPAPVVTALNPVLIAAWPWRSPAVISVRFLLPNKACSANPAIIGPARDIAVLADDKPFVNLPCCWFIWLLASVIALLNLSPETPPAFKAFSNFNVSDFINLDLPNADSKKLNFSSADWTEFIKSEIARSISSLLNTGIVGDAFGAVPDGVAEEEDCWDGLFLANLLLTLELKFGINPLLINPAAFCPLMESLKALPKPPWSAIAELNVGWPLFLICGKGLVSKIALLPLMLSSNPITACLYAKLGMKPPEDSAL